MKEKKKKTLLGEFLDLLICCFWLKLGVTYATLITITDDFESLESCLAHFRNTSMVWRHAPIYADVSRHMRPKFLVRFRCLFVHQSWESSCTTQVLLCTMTGLFPSVLVQTLWKQTRCLSVGPFFPPLIKSALSISSCFAQKVGRSLVLGRLYVPSFTTVESWQDLREHETMYFQLHNDSGTVLFYLESLVGFAVGS